MDRLGMAMRMRFKPELAWVEPGVEKTKAMAKMTMAPAQRRRRSPERGNPITFRAFWPPG